MRQYFNVTILCNAARPSAGGAVTAGKTGHGENPPQHLSPPPPRLLLTPALPHPSLVPQEPRPTATQ